MASTTMVTLNTFSSLQLIAQIPEMINHVFEPIANQVTRTILKQIGADELFERTISITSDHGAPAQFEDKNNNPILQAMNRVDCVFKPNLDITTNKWEVPHDRLTQKVEYGRNAPILFDPDSGVVIHEIMSQTTVNFDITITVTNKTLAFSILEKCFLMLDDDNPISLFELVYDYPLPMDMLCVLYDVFKLKGIPPELFVRAIQQYSANIIGVSQNTTSGKREIVVHKFVKETLAQIGIGIEEPTPVKVGQRTMVYQIPINVALQFNRPQLTIIQYPIIVNNQLIPERIIVADPAAESIYTPSYSPYLNEAKYQYMLEGQIDTIRCIKMPWYDPWRPCFKTPMVLFGYQPILVVAVTLEVDEHGVPTGETNIDLADLGDITLVDDVIDSITLSGGKCLYFTEKYNVAVYVNEFQAEQEMLTLAGTVLTLPHTELNKVYRLIISVKEEALNASLFVARVFNFDIYTGRR
jgi:hypothetical protein